MKNKAKWTEAELEKIAKFMDKYPTRHDLETRLFQTERSLMKVIILAGISSALLTIWGMVTLLQSFSPLLK